MSQYEDGYISFEMSFHEVTKEQEDAALFILHVVNRPRLRVQSSGEGAAAAS